jgi:hypothetical protein
MQWNLGWVTASETIHGTGDNHRNPRSIRVRVRQIGVVNALSKIFTVTQNPGSTSNNDSKNPFWQWGRKDAMPSNSTIYWNSPFSKQVVTNKASLAAAIQNPATFYADANTWTSITNWLNLWDCANPNNDSGWGAPTLKKDDTSIVKTVYDPNPVGWKMPPSNAWTGFFKTGYGEFAATDNIQNAQWSLATMSGQMVNGAWDDSKKGWNFYSGLNGGGTSVFYPSSGRLNNVTGAFSPSASYWSALPLMGVSGYTEVRSYSMDFNSGTDTDRWLYPVGSNCPSQGASVRPIKD